MCIRDRNQLVHNFNESLSFDQKFYAQDIRGSIAHVKMLGKQNIISEDEMNQIIKGLEGIKNDIDNGNLVFTKESEDIHSFVLSLIHIYSVFYHIQSVRIILS